MTEMRKIHRAQITKPILGPSVRWANTYTVTSNSLKNDDWCELLWDGSSPFVWMQTKSAAYVLRYEWLQVDPPA